MSITEQTAAVPTGTWQADTVHFERHVRGAVRRRDLQRLRGAISRRRSPTAA